MATRDRFEVRLVPAKSIPIWLTCKMCGRSYSEYDWTYNDKIVPLCIGCECDIRIRTEGVNFGWFQDYDVRGLEGASLLYRQSGQLAAAIGALEREIKCSKPA